MRDYIETRGNNPLKAVVKGSEANAHLVANLALLDGVEASMRQYGFSREQVLDAVAFFIEHRDIIERHYAETEANTSPAEESFERMRRKASAWKMEQADTLES